jgi:hypothetical protein
MLCERRIFLVVQILNGTQWLARIPGKGLEHHLIGRSVGSHVLHGRHAEAA